jgi:phage gpG-like protein
MAFAMKVTGQGKLASVVQDLGTIPARLMPKMLDDAGRYMVRTHLPEVFSSEGALIGQKWPESNRGGQTLSDTSTLRRSFTHAVQGSRLVVATPLPYAGIHNEGGVIRKKDKLLTVPMDSLTVSQRRAAKARDFKDTFVLKTKTGLLFIVQRTGKMVKDAKTGKRVPELKFLYQLREEVTIPQRMFLTWSELAQNEIMERWSDALIAEANRTGVN